MKQVENVYHGVLQCLNGVKKNENVIVTISMIVLFGVAVIALALTLLVGHFFFVETENSGFGYYNKFVHQYSIPCDDLSLSLDEDFDLFDIKRHRFTVSILRGKYICAFYNLTEVISKFVERIKRLRLSLGLEGKPYLQCGSSILKAGIGHLTAAFSKLSRHHRYKEQGEDQILFWDTRPTKAFIADTIDYNRGKVRVPESRFYFAYATVLFNISSMLIKTSSKPNQQLKASLRICVSNEGYEQTLLSKANVYNTSEFNIVSSLNVAGSVFLSKGVEVYVKTANAAGFSHDLEGNSFGIFPFN